MFVTSSQTTYYAEHLYLGLTFIEHTKENIMLYIVMLKYPTRVTKPKTHGLLYTPILAKIKLKMQIRFLNHLLKLIHKCYINRFYNTKNSMN